LKELKSGMLPEPVELTGSQLDMVAAGQVTGFVKQSNRARVSIGNNDSVTSTGGSVSIGTGNMVMISQLNTNSGSVSAIATASAGSVTASSTASA
jgi:hypothetical protein